MFLGETKPLYINTGQDISSAISVEVLVIDPSGNKGTIEGEVYNDNYIQANLTTSNIDEAGKWVIQGKVTTSSGDFFTEIETIDVYNTIEE